MAKEFGACEMGKVIEKMVIKIKEEFIRGCSKGHNGRLETIQPGQEVIA